MTMKNLIQSIIFLITMVMATTGAQEVIYAQVGERIVIPGASGKDIYVSWWFGSLQLAWLNPLGGRNIEAQDEKWKNRLALNGNSLTISDIQQEFFGTFSCKLSSGGQTKSTTEYQVIQLNVGKPDTPLLPGDPLSLTCNSQGQNSNNIHWLTPQGQKLEKNKVSFNAISEHNGRWNCVVTHKGKEQQFPVFVTVVDLAPEPLHQYTSTNSYLTVPCSILSGITWEQIKQMSIEEVDWQFFPKPFSSPISNNQQQLFYLNVAQLTWIKAQDSGLKPSHSLQKGNLSLTKPKAKIEDRGNYTCSMKFKNGQTLKRTVEVDVLQIISSPGTKLIYGQQVNLSCTTGDLLPTGVHLKWIPPKSSSQHASADTHHITIKEVGKDDNGRWRCELWQGGKNLTSVEILLEIEPRLTAWMLGIICSAAVIVFLLLILAFIHYRRRKQKMRHLRQRLCHCKNPKPKGFYRT